MPKVVTHLRGSLSKRTFSTLESGNETVRVISLDSMILEKLMMFLIFSSLFGFIPPYYGTVILRQEGIGFHQPYSKKTEKLTCFF
jgi:hypothetical protein